MRVFEIFRSIQGESTRAGLAMDFVRLAGCDLKCTYCDTAAARDFAAGRDMTVAEVLAAVGTAADPDAAVEAARADAAGRPAAPLEWLEITGGEPAHQAAEVNALVAALIDSGRKVMIETNGANPIDLFDPRAVRIVDVKTPGSGMADRNCWRNLDLLAPQDEVKFVLTGRADYEWAKHVLSRHGLAGESAKSAAGRAAVLFSPASPALDGRTLAEWIVADALPVRLNLQIHKYLRLP